MNGPITENASFTQNTIQTTVRRITAGVTFTVDEQATSDDADILLCWLSHSIVTKSPQAGPAGTQYVWNIGAMVGY
jgi:hypothetical protein